MGIPSADTIVIKLFAEVDTLLNHYVHDGYQALVSILKVPLGLGIALYVMFMGIAITQGWVKLTMGNLVKSTIKIALIYACAMNWDFFSEYAVDLITNAADEVGTAMIRVAPLHLPHSMKGGVEMALQTAMIEFSELGLMVARVASLKNISAYFTADIIWGFGYALVLLAMFELLLAKIMLAILFATAPLFVSFTLFKPTHGFFDRWLGNIVGFALLMVFVSLTVGMALTITEWALPARVVGSVMKVDIVSFVPVMVIGFMGIGIILKSAQLAQSIGSGVSTLSGSALVAGTVGGMIGASMQSLNLAQMGMKPLGMASKALGATRQFTQQGGNTVAKGIDATSSAIRKTLQRGK